MEILTNEEGREDYSMNYQICLNVAERHIGEVVTGLFSMFASVDIASIKAVPDSPAKASASAQKPAKKAAKKAAPKAGKRRAKTRTREVDPNVLEMISSEIPNGSDFSPQALIEAANRRGYDIGTLTRSLRRLAVKGVLEKPYSGHYRLASGNEARSEYESAA